MKSKVIILNGAATEEYLYDASKNINSFIAPEILSDIVDLTIVGDPSSGFKFQEMHQLISKLI